MFSAYFYRIRKQAIKKPIVLILSFIAVAFCVAMMFYPMLMSNLDVVVRNKDLIIAGLNIILIAITNFVFFTGLSNGAVGFSNSDVNFHLAGPFTPRFNLILAASGVLKIVLVFLWVFICQSATLTMTLGINTSDMFAFVLSAGVTIAISYALGAFFCCYYDNNENAKKRVTGVAIAIELVFVALIFFSLYRTYGSVSAISALGVKQIITAAGSTFAIKAFPIAGWISLIYTGIVLKNVVYSVIGILLLLAVIALIVILYSKFDLNYYETALVSAQKVADMNEAKKAGIDSDNAKINQKVKVGKEKFNAGWGVSAFFHRHLFENKRASKFYFINTLAITYKVVVFIYLLILNYDDSTVQFVSGLIMLLVLNSVVFGGGKTVLEFNRPYIFMVPEKGSKKVMSCLLASIPEMVFDSILGALIMVYFAKLGIIEAITCGIMLLIYDVICQLIGLLSVRYFRSLGRILLMLLRYLIIYAVALIAFVPGIIVMFAVGKVFGFITIAVIGLILNALLMIPASRVVDNVELT